MPDKGVGNKNRVPEEYIFDEGLRMWHLQTLKIFRLTISPVMERS